MLQVRDIRKGYRNTVALDGASLSVTEGETVVLMGPSGCGKSTILRCITRLTEPDSGQVWIRQQPVMDMDDDQLRRLRRKVGFVFQHANLIQHLTAWDNVLLPLVMGGMDPDAAHVQAAQALDRVGLGDQRRRTPDRLSGGERQRVGIARALAMGPELMLWDEPTASLDPILVREVLDVMEELVANSRTTMLIVTHEVGFARRVADRVVFMEAGRIVESGPPAEVFHAPRSEVARRYRRLLIA